MQSDFAGDLSTKNPDALVFEAVAERPGKPLKMRVQPMILRMIAGRGGQYRSWKQVRWTLDCDTAAEVFATRDVMRTFFDVLGRCGPEAVQAALVAANAAATYSTAAAATKQAAGNQPRKGGSAV